VEEIIMKTFRFFVCLLAGVLLLTAVFPEPVSANTTAGSTDTKLTIINKTAAPITVSFKGPKSFTVTAQVGNTTLDAPKGEYWYEYRSCGAATKGKISAKGPRTKLTIPACKLAGVVLHNWGSGTITLTLTGPKNYFFTTGPASVNPQQVLEGTYKWTLTGSCGSKTGTKMLKYSKRTRYWFEVNCDIKPGYITIHGKSKGAK
jgi:hypothetical protein